MKASKLDAYKRTVADCTHGIAFLGTPHQGSDKTKWAKIGQNVLALLGKQDSTLLQDLEKQSSRLAKLGQDFPEWLRNRAENTANKVSIMCFFEELDTITGGKSIGQVRKKG